MKFEKHWTNAIGHCAGCGESLRGIGLDFGPQDGDCLCPNCANDIAQLVAEREQLAREQDTSVVRAKRSGHRPEPARA
jgi:recombinational DNA repair protein (RecF pathway)